MTKNNSIWYDDDDIEDFEEILKESQNQTKPKNIKSKKEILDVEDEDFEDYQK